MESLSSQIEIYYQFTSAKSDISNQQRKDVSTILNVSARFKLFINSECYFDQEEFPILEFYKYLYNWKIASNKYKIIQEFHYYSLEFDDYNEGAILSLIPFGNSARLESIWAERERYYIFDLTYLSDEFMKLEVDLKESIESYFDINLDKFIKYIPSMNFDWHTGK
ncbi:DUF7878 domain-containing protein [Gracilibacillus suaedae]|uniref:DUF7878 domain-containing protein n=1 Tax=Gracilibacillus suaedae TaxID=2820273 RepID=UPI001ABE4C38|nr:hypothetical protein [Gracilibacillus suaedae]